MMNLLNNAHEQITRDMLENMEEGDSIELNKRFSLYKYEIEDYDDSLYYDEELEEWKENKPTESFVLEDNKYDTDTFSVQYKDDEIVLTDFYGYDDDEDFNN